MRLGLVLGGIATGYNTEQEEARKEAEFNDAQDIRNRQAAARKDVAALPQVNSTTTDAAGTSVPFSSVYTGDPASMPSDTASQNTWLAANPPSGTSASPDPNPANSAARLPATGAIQGLGSTQGIAPASPAPAPAAAAPVPPAAPAPPPATPAAIPTSMGPIQAIPTGGVGGTQASAILGASGDPNLTPLGSTTPPPAAVNAKTPPSQAISLSQAQPGQVVARSTAPLADNIRAMATNEHLDPNTAETAVAIGILESHLNATVRNNGTSTGLFQFHPDTFAKYGGTDITDTRQQINAEFQLIQDANSKLTPILGRAPTPAEIYMYHQQGTGGGTALLKADPDASAISVVGRFYKTPAIATAAIVNNWPTGKKNAPTNPTVGQFLGAWDNKVSQVLASPLTARSGQPNPSVPTPTDEEAQALADSGATPTAADPNDTGTGMYNSPSPGGQVPLRIAPAPTPKWTAYTDETGQQRVTQQPHQLTADDLDQRTIDIYRQHGLTDQVATLQANLQARQANELTIKSKQMDVDNDVYDQKITDAERVFATNPSQGVQMAEDAANSRGSGVQSKAQQNPDGTVNIYHYNNQTGEMVGVDLNQDPTKLFDTLHSLKDGTTVLAQAQLARENEVKNKTANAAMQDANTQQQRLAEEVKAGTMTAQAAALQANAIQSRSSAAYSDTLAAAANIDTQQKLVIAGQINNINKQLADPTIPYATKLQLQAQLGSLNGKVDETTFSLNGGMEMGRVDPVTHVLTMYDQTAGDFIPAPEHATIQALPKDQKALISGGQIQVGRTASGDFRYQVPGYIDAQTGQAGTFGGWKDAYAAYKSMGKKAPTTWNPGDPAPTDASGINFGAGVGGGYQ